LFSMVRNIGGAIGIALSSQIVVEREKLHAQRIGESVTSFAQATQERLVETVNMLSHVHLDHATALYSAGAAR
ncbi:EmrB/QacA family drug resistance transporter, partial [Mesorhizobium sp. M7A.F.Ca.MR.362.00.0.0]